MAKDPIPQEQASQGWQFWSIGVDAEEPTSHDMKKAPTSHVVTKAMKLTQDAQENLPLPSGDNIMKTDGWQFWALGEQATNIEQPSTAVAAPINETSAGIAPTSGPKKGWKFWAIGVRDKTNMDPNVLFSENIKADQASVALKAQAPTDSRDECAWQYWSQMHHREEPRMSSDFDSKEAWQFWAIGVSDAASQISLLTEAFEMDPPMLKIVKIKTLQPIEALDDESGWRYWSNPKKDAALKPKEVNTNEGWQFYAIGGAHQAATDQQFIASEHFAVEPPIAKPVAPNLAESRDESGRRYWSRAPADDVPTAATNVASKKGWQFWAIQTTNQSPTRKNRLSSGLQSDSAVVKTKDRQRRERRDESGWRYWSTIETEDTALTSANVGKKQGWQFWALGRSDQPPIDRKPLLTEGINAEFPAMKNRDAMESREGGGWQYWSRINEDSLDDLQRDDMLSPSQFPLYPQGETGTTFTANPKFYTIKKALERIDEEKASKDTLSCDEALNTEDKERSQALKPSEAIPCLGGSFQQEGGTSSTNCIVLPSATAAKEPYTFSEKKTKAATIKKGVSDTIQNFKKSLPSFEEQKEKLSTLDNKIRSKKNKDSELIIPKRGMLPKDWIHKSSQTKTRTFSFVKEKKERYQLEASRLFAQAEQRKQEKLRFNENVSDMILEDVVLRGISATATNAVETIQNLFSSFRKKETEDREEEVKFSSRKDL
ncbi:MAG: hypothetical protein SGBAC_011451 [Bacillariaceae sp.]